MSLSAFKGRKDSFVLKRTLTGRSANRNRRNLMIVHGSTLSPFVRKVMVFAAEKGLTVENNVQTATASIPLSAKARMGGT